MTTFMKILYSPLHSSLQFTQPDWFEKVTSKWRQFSPHPGTTATTPDSQKYFKMSGTEGMWETIITWKVPVFCRLQMKAKRYCEDWKQTKPNRRKSLNGTNLNWKPWFVNVSAFFKQFPSSPVTLVLFSYLLDSFIDVKPRLTISKRFE